MLVQFVQLIHLLGILFILMIPFQNMINLLVLHVSASLSILTHWYVNDNTCFLSVVEAKLRGIPKDHGFIHSLVAPIYDMNKSHTTMLSYIVLLCLMFLSIYKIYISKRMEEALELYSKRKDIRAFLLLLVPESSRT